MKCRFCATELTHVFCDLGHAPPSNSYLKPAELNEAETHYPLKVWTCPSCFLTQIDEFKSHAEIFSKDYAYFSSTIASWVAHAKDFVDQTEKKFSLGKDSLFVEVASNDGWMLQHVQAKGIPCLGVEPTASTAAAARAKGLTVRQEFFGAETARRMVAEGLRADVTMGVHVLAHVPDIVDFLTGFKILLKPEGVAVFQFPHLLALVRDKLFDTIYHEHFSYLSLLTVEKIANSVGLKVIEVEELPVHGGSFRVYTAHADSARARHPSVDAVLAQERAAGMETMDFYAGFQDKIEKIKTDLLSFLLEMKKQGKTVAAYGVAAKGCTLLNYAGVRADLIPFACDISPHKQGLYMPGSHIPIFPPAKIDEEKPDVILILAWNLKREIAQQLSAARGWGAKFAVAIPELEVF